MLLPLLLAAVSALSYPPEGYVREDNVDSPQHTFTVESWRKETQGPTAALCLWVVSADRTKAELLVAPGVLTPLYSAEASISPDERWIRWEEKLYHGADAHGLFEREAGTRFREIGPPLFDQQAWDFFSQQTQRTFKTEDTVHVMRVSDWPTRGSLLRRIALYGDSELFTVPTPNDHCLLISLAGDDRERSVRLWFCFYDLRTRRFFLDAALRKHNRDRIGPSRER